MYFPGIKRRKCWSHTRKKLSSRKNIECSKKKKEKNHATNEKNESEKEKKENNFLKNVEFCKKKEMSA